jgi:hypothetical protein
VVSDDYLFNRRTYTGKPDDDGQELFTVRRWNPPLRRIGAQQSGGRVLPAPPGAQLQVEDGRRGRSYGAPVRGVQARPAHRDLLSSRFNLLVVM